MATTVEEFDWSFMGAVIVISLACFALIISCVYYCWLYEVTSSCSRCILSMCGVETKKSNKRKERVILPVSTRYPPYPNVNNNRINNENTQRHVVQRPKNGHTLRRSNSSQNGSSRPTTGSQQTRQRAVNIAIHELKSRDQREDPPTKPAKSEVVKAYVSAGASTSSVVESYSSTTITDNMMTSDSVSESESEYRQAELEDRSEVAGTSYNVESKDAHDQAARERSENLALDKVPRESYRTRKWSKINRKVGEKENRLTQVTEQLMHKPGRSTRAVAPYTLQQSGRHIETGSKRRLDAENLKPGTIFEVLQSLRKSGNLGTNPIDNPVSRLFTSDTERNKNVIETFKQSLMNEEQEPSNEKLSKLEDSSASDEIKSSSDSDTESSLIVISRSTNLKQSSASSNANNPSATVESSCDKTNYQVETDSISADQPELVPNNTLKTPQNIDPSKQVFGREDITAPDLDKRESLVRRIDSLFCSTTPSSMGSCVSDNVFEEQIDHNINNLNNLNYSNQQSSDQQIHSENRSSDDDDIIIGNKKNPESAFITQPNLYEPNEEPKIMTRADLVKQSKSAAGDGIVDESEESSSSSFNSTTLPSVTSNSNTSTTLTLSSEEENTPGKLKFFQ